MRGSKRAMSQIISTVIIAGSLLIIAAIASWLSASMFEIQSQQAELERAEDAFNALATIIEECAAKPGSSAYVRFNPRTGGVEVLRDYASITITVGNYSTSYSISTDTDILAYRGGAFSTIPGLVIIRGDETVQRLESSWRNESLIVDVDDSDVPIAWVYEEHSGGAYVYLDCIRVKINDLGEITVNDIRYRVVEVLFIRLTYGEARGGEVVDVKVSGLNKTVNQYVFQGPSSVSIQVQVDLDDEIFQDSAEISLSGYGGCIVYLVVSTVRVDLL